MHGGTILKYLEYSQVVCLNFFTFLSFHLCKSGSWRGKYQGLSGLIGMHGGTIFEIFGIFASGMFKYCEHCNFKSLQIWPMEGKVAGVKWAHWHAWMDNI